MAVISVIFPFYQDAEKGSKFSNIYVPASVFSLAVPLFFMESTTRFIIALIMVGISFYFVYKSFIKNKPLTN